MATLNENKINNVVEMKEGKNNNHDSKKNETDYGYGITDNSKLVFSDNANFVSFGRIMRVTNKDLAMMIKSYFGTVLHDLRGVMIYYTPSPRGGFHFDTRFYFQINAQDLPEGKIKSVIDLTKPDEKLNSKSFYARQKAIVNASSQNIFTINDATRLILSDFIYGGRNANKPRSNVWSNGDRIKQMDMLNGMNNVNSGYLTFYRNNAHDVYIEVNDIDLKVVLNAIFGNTMVVETKKTESGKDTNYERYAKYNPRFIEYTKTDPSVFFMNIEQFDYESVDQMAIDNDVRIFSSPNGMIKFFTN